MKSIEKRKEELEEELNSESYKTELNRNKNIIRSFLFGIKFVSLQTQRAPDIFKNNLFLGQLDDLMQSLVSIEVLAEHGVRNTCLRETRYLLEAAIKCCYIEQKDPDYSLEGKLQVFKDVINDSNINYINEIRFPHFDKDTKASFVSDAKKYYGISSNYIHLSQVQIIERMDLVEDGKYIGFEGTEELKELNDRLRLCLSYVLVLLFACIPEWIIGDFLVEPTGQMNNWYFQKSKYISEIDKNFDYKAERKGKIEKLIADRKERIEF